MQREFPHNTDEQVADYLERTLRIMGEQGIDADHFAAVFPVVFNSVSGKQILIEQASMGGIAMPASRGH